MKKILFPLILLIISLSDAEAQVSSFMKGYKVLSLNGGISTNLFSGSYYVGKVPPVSAAMEFGIAGHILDEGVVGIGPYIGYSTFKYEYAGDGWDYTCWIPGIKGTFHYPFADGFDTYAGMIAGYRYLQHKEIGDVEDKESYMKSRVTGAWFVGARYYFLETVAVMAEVGYGISYVNAGISFKF